jgi:hypothetical protein
MKRSFKLASLITAATMVVGTSVVIGAGGPPGGGFYTGQTIQNIGTTTASMQVQAVSATDGSIAATANFTASVGSAKTFLANDPALNLPAGFQGSAIVSADQPVRAIVNVTNRPLGTLGITGGTAAAQYAGADETRVGTTLAFPLAKNNFGANKTTAFYIQNAGTADATFTAVFRMGAGLAGPFTPFTYTSPSLKPGQMAVVFPGDATGVSNQSIGSLTVSSAQMLAGTVLEYDQVVQPALILQGTYGAPSALADTKIYFPVVKKLLANRSTGLQVQNADTVPVTVSLTYNGADDRFGCPTTMTPVVEPDVLLQPGELKVYLNSTLLPTNCLASAIATATGGNIAATVNEAFLAGTAAQRATLYAAYPAKTATTKLVAPVYKDGPNNGSGNKETGLSIQNIGLTTANVTLEFAEGSNKYVYSTTIPAGQSALFFKMFTTSLYPDANWTGGAAGRLAPNRLYAVTVTSSQPIVGLANEAPVTVGGTPLVAQDNINYEAFNVTP